MWSGWRNPAPPVSLHPESGPAAKEQQLLGTPQGHSRAAAVTAA